MSTLATGQKKPLTKKDLKAELEKYPTKKDLKAELEKYVAKNEFTVAMSRIDDRFQQLEAKMYTKEDHARYMVLFDEAMSELRDARDARVLSERQMLRIDDTVYNHEKRIVVLENKNPVVTN